MRTDFKQARQFDQSAAKGQGVLNVAILDSNVMMRQMLTNLLRNIDGVRILLSSGMHDAKKIDELKGKQNLDLLFLELEPKDEGGFQLFIQIRKEYPDLPVVLMTPLSGEGARAALEGLRFGAVDYITKPDRSMGLVLASKHFYKRVLPIVRSSRRINRNKLMEYSLPGEANLKEEEAAMRPEKEVKTSSALNIDRLSASPKVDLVLASGCLGGVHSLYRWIASLPDELPVPIVVVQHMPKIYTRNLAQELNRLTNLKVSEAVHNQLLEPGQIYLAPGGYHTEIRNDGSNKTLVLHRGPREHRNRPSVDVLFRSAAQIYRDRVLGICLSGGGEDGFRGAYEIAETGGKIVVENRRSSILWELPEKVAKEGLASGQAEAEKLGAEILDYIYGEPLKEQQEAD